jgi:hypothetical protein
MLVTLYIYLFCCVAFKFIVAVYMNSAVSGMQRRVVW